MTRPFVVLGAMKSGTTTLEEVLRDLPGVSIVTEKEATSLRDDAGSARFLERVVSSQASAAGEVSTAYMQSPDIEVDPFSANEIVSGLHALAIVREPFDRALSHWRHWAQLGRNPAQLDAARLLDPEGPYVAYSSYFRQLRPWLEALGAERLLVLRLEDYAASPQQWVDQVVDFLGVDRTLVGAESVLLNGAEDRVVARGLGARIARNAVYRRVVRPLVPSSLRGRSALALGGRRGGSAHGDDSAQLRAAFAEVIREDTLALQRQWRHLSWVVDRESLGLERRP